MKTRKWAIAIGVGLSISGSISIIKLSEVMSPQTVSSFDISTASVSLMLGQANTSPEETKDFFIENEIFLRSHWPLLLATGLGVGAIALGFHQYRLRCRQYRVEYASRVYLAFKERPGVKNVLAILDFEEYRTQYFIDPMTGEKKSFEATDARLGRSLREHDAMVKIKASLVHLNKSEAFQHRTLKGNIVEIDRNVYEQYKTTEFPIEITLRNWFDEFLTGLEEIEAMIQAGLFTSGDIKPFIIYWIQVIADRSIRRKGGASFYDPLFHYIHYAGYTGVESLFERYGYKVLPPPYSPTDFEQDLDSFETDQTSSRKISDSDYVSFDDNELYRALCCAKASILVYEDEGYMSDIARIWCQSKPEPDYRNIDNIQFFSAILDSWQREENKRDLDIQKSFRIVEDKATDTQAFIYRKQKQDQFDNANHIILVFRGTEKFQDWQTNLTLSLQTFTIDAPQEIINRRESHSGGKVHRGFYKALKSVESEITSVLDEWGAHPPRVKSEFSDLEGTPQIWITGHSLGGALAALAAVSLKCQGFNVSGLYTFGQPRTADWVFGSLATEKLKNIPIHRYVNNNDIVPLIPPGFVPWQPTRIYGHFGDFKYFDSGGNLHRKSFPAQRIPNRLWGFLTALFTIGPDAVSDHFMEFYIANLQKALEKEKEALRNGKNDP